MGRMMAGSLLRWFAYRAVFAVSLLAICMAGHSLQAQVAPTEDGPAQASSDVSKPHFIDNDTIVKMSKAGLDDTVILQTIQTQPGRYDTTPDDLISLKKAGVSEQVIAAMQARSAGLSFHANSKVDPAPLAAGVDEIGVYYQDKKTGEWIPLKTERVEFKSSGWLKNAATDGIVKQDMNGHLEGPKSDLVLPTGVNILIYAPAGTQAEEYDFLRFEEHSHSRDFRVKTSGLFHSTTGSQRDEIIFNPHKIAPQMYEFTVPVDIEKGEYGVLPPGSSNVPGISNAGKIFTFSISE
ncbi:MAG TPA: hypothetical protein VGF82_02495 [Terracidiphilus sp.]|jgi:hypothetical protein